MQQQEYSDQKDKGSAVVVMNTTDYLREGYRQLGDTNFYTKLKNDPTDSVSDKITRTLIEMKNKGYITEENLDHLKPAKCTTGQFYLLPKIHKKNIPGRPICSSVTHPTSRIRKFVDAHIKKYVPTTKSYIRDTQDFITKIKQLGPIPEGAILVTLNVSSLYTNIPNQEGITAVADQLRKDPTKKGISSYILDLLKLVLHNMYFEFNGDHYLQIGGTAMGTALVPNYANIFMDKFETRALENYPLKPILWKRFIDDIFMVWTHGEEQLNKFVQYLNNIHPTIKFTHECSKEEINFLDTTVKILPDRSLYTTLYNKPTDTHLYLHYHSAHPHSVTANGPFGQFLRVRRICTLNSDYQINGQKLIKYYLDRGYPLKPLENHYKKAARFSQDDLLQTKNKKLKTPQVLVTTYNPRNPNISQIIRNNWNIIENTEDLQQIFPNKPLIGYRRLPNLRDILTSNKISWPPKEIKINNSKLPPVCTRLGKCTYCPRLHKIKEFYSTHTKRIHKCINLPEKHRITCEIYNIIYLIQCTKCHKQYIGETGRPFRARIYEHTASVKNPKKSLSTPVSRHFTTENHSHKDMRFSVVQWLGNETGPDITSTRRKHELRHIWDIPTIAPIGINQYV